MKGRWIAIAAALAAVACGEEDPAAEIAAATPATGEALTDYSESITKDVKLLANADLVQRFCHNMTGSACAPGIADQLKQAGFGGQGSGVELARAFVLIEADKRDGLADLGSSDETFWKAAYKVVLAREPDAEGAMANLSFIKNTGERQQMLRALLQSPEFKKLS